MIRTILKTQRKMKMRTRTFEIKVAEFESSVYSPIEIKDFTSDDEGMMFSGYGSVFGNKDYHGDVVAKGAFRDTLREAKKSGTWPAMLLQHGSMLGGFDDMPVGIWTSMKEDDTGLAIEGKLAETSRGKDAYTLLKMKPRPAITGLSIGFRAKKWDLGTKPDEPRRTIRAVDLMEVSLVTMPANPKARVTSVKSIEEIETIRDFEKFLRDAGFSNSQAKSIASHGYRPADLRDEDEAKASVMEAIRANIMKLSQR